MQDLERQLNSALNGGEPQAIIDARLALANALVNQGMLARAREQIREAAALEQGRGNVPAQARCQQMLASLYRLDSKFGPAREAARLAIELAGDANPVTVAAYTELGEVARLAAEYADAEQAYAQALEHGIQAGLLVPNQLTLVLRRAEALTQLDRAVDAAELLAHGRAQAEEAGERAAAVRCGVAEATAWHHAGQPERAERLGTELVPQAQDTGDHKALADLAMLAGTRALERKDLEQGIAQIIEARQQALQAPDASVYIAASAALAQARELRDDQVGAYEALAVGWVTLGDLLGAEAARQIYEPLMRERIGRWGRPAFDQAKAAYEARRRAELGRRG